MTNHDFWILYKRFSPSEQYGCREGGRIHVIASLLAGAEVGTDQLTAPEHSFKREQQLGKIQEKRIEDWAKAAGFWISNTDETYEQTLGEKIAQGGEAVVYDNGNKVLKAIGLDYFIQPIFALDRISLHNAYFEETEMNVLGFGRNTNKDFMVIVEQPFIHGKMMADTEIATFVEQMGFKSINPRNWTFANKDIYLSDMHDENVLHTPDGHICVIDCDIRINIPELRTGGTRILTNKVEFQLE